jgi:PEP-CTERM motif-containing protein
VTKNWLIASVAVGALALGAQAQATTIGFEGFAPGGGLVNINPGAPYSESGFTFTPTNNQSAVFDSAAATDFPGDTTDFFGFQENNIITMTGPSAFNLDSLLLGQNTLGGGPTSITLVGHLAGGGSLNATFANLTTATLETLNWSGLSSVEFRVTDDSAIDDIHVAAVPEPASLLLLGTGLGFAARLRKRVKKSE